MAGHNKWSKIKRGKAITDAKRGNAFSKLSKEITLAAKAGGGSPDMNARLRSAILAARAANVPNDNIDRAIKKGTGELGGAQIEEVLYEAYAPGGVAMMIEIVTDNRNRSFNDIRVLLSKNSGTLADSGSVAYMFTRRGEIRLDKTAATEDQIMEVALDAGAEDIQEDGDDWVVYTATDQLFQVAGAMREKGLASRSQKLIYQPQTTVTVSDVDTAKSLIRLYDILDDYDDSQHIHANFEIDDAIADQLE
ncbi:YebC/PmpR family DNA-binding transcriptional regulator [Prosthecobacter sp.]|uniref:YebC/PmpR family DNA-binding transcriptional regulator n=1 Tax=Prosthecobacter sp. TaxID=1965333 RepID=UPI001D5F894C|nr:YebC/PmpR family DNA-binding transcriptional regulator [Prosthecobacter sp.]MCB1277868.1 YebC/PmpR family DNA-binding transcriptional regulator [Prosthecobacter sp.]